MSTIKLSFNDGNDLGTTAHKAYAFLARRYKWDINLVKYFEPRQLLYAADATSEGYSVWFLPHSNFISEEDTNGLWKNTFNGDKIHEEWLPSIANKPHSGLHTDKSTRVVFAKKASGKYYFMGVYEVTNIEKKSNGSYVKTYNKISREYPMY